MEELSLRLRGVRTPGLDKRRPAVHGALGMGDEKREEERANDALAPNLAYHKERVEGIRCTGVMTSGGNSVACL